ncbi:glycosyltransferase family 2 protein [Limnoglobus roseus]|uniref:GT2 family glycosyltransferase n=1 Tax=Limnoglobus roseus TaxID=2598579 RepID=A0A5C1A6W2_9BACT|nr:glycosyltransferase [Limnoglobus roseus]QEL13572.1 GT2 family glycosyltransferase [Limnoglobus roseus]
MPGDSLVLALALAAGLVLLATDTPTRNPWFRLAAVLFLHALTIAYVGWRWSDTLPAFAGTPTALWVWAFFAAEAVAIVYEVWSVSVLIRVTNHTPEANRYEAALRATPDLPMVDVFVPTYSENAEILERTIRAALALDYPRDRLKIWLLDDGKRPWLKELCDKYGVGCVVRPTNEHGKAGNLNYALPRTAGEYLLVIDADFELDPRFLLRALGFLLFRIGIGLVQTPQHFRNPDPVQYNLFGGRAWTEEQFFFMTMAQSARDSYGNAFCVGSGWVVPRARLTELGGFPQSSICEDLEITYALKARGWRTLFLNEPLAIGLAPESVPEYIKQRARWCSGTIQHAYIKTGPFRGRGLSWLDRLFYLEPILYWFTFPFTVLMLFAPAVFWLTGVSAIPGAGDGLYAILLPRFVAAWVVMYWLSEGRVIPPISAVQRSLGAFHFTAALAKAVVQPFGRPFQVTAKGQARDRVVIQWAILRPFAVLAGLTLFGMALNLTGWYEVVTINSLTAVDVAWSVYALTLLALCVFVCVERPKAGSADAPEVRKGSVVGTATALARRVFG